MHTVFARLVGHFSRWGRGRGWQAEIAIWNLATLTTGAGLIPVGEAAERAQVRGYTVLSVLLSLNHFRAAVQSPRFLANWFAMFVQLPLAAVGFAALAEDRRQRTKNLVTGL